MQFDEPVAALAIAAQAAEPLDEALAVGYPFSRLEDGVSAPQGVTGFVRRVTENVLELDTALNPGLSGGPILNLDGDVIGMAIGVLRLDFRQQTHAGWANEESKREQQGHPRQWCMGPSISVTRPSIIRAPRVMRVMTISCIA